MSNILEEIIAHKVKEVEAAKAKKSIQQLEKNTLFKKPSLSLSKALQADNASGIIAEFKRKSPSKGILNDQVRPDEVVFGYEAAGATAVSILTDEFYFGGAKKDLILGQATINIPALRKDFTIDEYQVIEAKAMGADVILLIAAALSPNKIKELAQLAKSVHLDVLLEVHNLEELETSVNEFVDIVGVNNRDLKTFNVSIQTSLDLVEKIPNDFVKISESGISKVEVIQTLREAGYQGFLMGENFMKNQDPAEACQEFIQKLYNLS